MKEELVEFETAKLAKEKGFNELVENYFEITTISKPISENTCKFQNINGLKSGNLASRPTQSLLQKWIREKNDIHIVVLPNSEKQFFYEVFRNFELPFESEELYSVLSGRVYNTYEEALEKGLYEALKLINK